MPRFRSFRPYLFRLRIHSRIHSHSRNRNHSHNRNHSRSHSHHDNSHIFKFLLVVELLNKRECGFAHHANTHNVQREVDIAVDNSRVGDNLGRCGVEDNIVEVLAQIVNQLLKTCVHKELCGVGRCLLTYNVVKVLRGLALGDNLAEVIFLAKQIMDDTHAVVAVDGLRRTALAQVKV